MPIFVLMTKLAPDAMHDAQGRKAVGREWLHKVKTTCPDVTWIGHYALLGPYDYMDIYDAPDHATAHTVSMISRSGGAVSAESWQAMPWEEHLRLMVAVG
jgi:uncharacterized protein with GYD domain